MYLIFGLVFPFWETIQNQTDLGKLARITDVKIHFNII